MNIDDIRYNKSAIQAGNCVSEGWNLVKPNYWLFLGITLLAIVVSGCGLPIISWIVMGPTTVGIYYAMLAQMRGGPVAFEMMFKGFSRFVPAMVVGFLVMLPGIVGNG